MEIIEDTTELKNEDQIELEAKEFEFLMPIHALVKLRPFVDRYFIKYYQTFGSSINSGLPNNQYAFLHTNKLFMIGIAKEHEIVTQKLRLKKVLFEGLGHGNGLAVKGKKKSKGGIRVKTGQKMCTITTEDDKVFTVYALVDGNVIEINEAVEADPNIILDSPESKGYIAIINSGLKIEKYIEKLIPEAKYQEMMSKEKISNAIEQE